MLRCLNDRLNAPLHMPYSDLRYVNPSANDPKKTESVRATPKLVISSIQVLSFLNNFFVSQPILDFNTAIS